MNPIGIIFIVILVMLILLLTCKGVTCWYLRINERIEAAEEQNIILEEILKELRNGR